MRLHIHDIGSLGNYLVGIPCSCIKDDDDDDMMMMMIVVIMIFPLLPICAVTSYI